MELHRVPENSTIIVTGSDTSVPVGCAPVLTGERLKFLHIDGMYSLCKDMDGNPVHLVAWAEVEVVEDGDS